MNYKCTLDTVAVSCEYLNSRKQCAGNANCSFCMADEPASHSKKEVSLRYVRKERWYEKYYKSNKQTEVNA